ncbi:hypothetical protein BS50DRAFT_593313 [Corynespora cassiicola Philippines]|uniref:Uncharacterized protein n=1 Tax=Corynespora cassiicola Philippines TaxID=1448308 RepID=A0A2T2N6A2_CORCC|nr:hypothetical protein BS50DRAFT_593313 [Corynespora cassiicola Philippines]
MHLSTLLPSLALAAPALCKRAIVINNCDFPVWLTSTNSHASFPPKLIPSNGTWSEEQKFDGRTGQAIAITRKDQYSANPTLTFGYTFRKEVPDYYYDIGTTYGFDFENRTVTLRGEDHLPVPDITWNGAPKAQDTKRYIGLTDLVLTLCDD